MVWQPSHSFEHLINYVNKYADDSAATGTLEQLYAWWNRLAAEDLAFGYFPNPSKTWLVTKQNHFDEASSMFAGSGVNVTPDGRPYPGAVIGSNEYVGVCKLQNESLVIQHEYS